MISAPMASTRVRLEHTSPENKAKLAPIAPRHGRRCFQRSGLGLLARDKGSRRKAAGWEAGGAVAEAQHLGRILEGGGLHKFQRTIGDRGHFAPAGRFRGRCVMISAPMASTRVRLEHTSTENKAKLAPIALGTGGVAFKDQVRAVSPRPRGEREESCRLGSRPCDRRGGAFGPHPGRRPRTRSTYRRTPSSPSSVAGRTSGAGDRESFAGRCGDLARGSPALPARGDPYVSAPRRRRSRSTGPGPRCGSGRAPATGAPSRGGEEQRLPGSIRAYQRGYAAFGR